MLFFTQSKLGSTKNLNVNNHFLIFSFWVPWKCIPDFDLKPDQILENVPSPVLAKSPTGIGQIANRY